MSPTVRSLWSQWGIELTVGFQSQRLKHFGGSYKVPEAEGMEKVDIDWQVAEVSHSILAVSEACDKG